ncbi:hypothetical protein [Cysteiniphilum litorale]|uniref:hypothetical protein n=1 Tax=Cysteiniphilum litorale TaxID=2056700 RepID=UPI003F884BAF
MRYFFYLSFLSSFFFVNTVFAGYLTIDDSEEDIVRVTNNVKYFYTENYEELEKIKTNSFSFDKNKCEKELIKISQTELYLDYKYNKNCFVSDFNNLKKYVSQNKEVLLKKLGEPDYQYFVNGLYYIQKILTMRY